MDSPTLAGGVNYHFERFVVLTHTGEKVTTTTTNDIYVDKPPNIMDDGFISCDLFIWNITKLYCVTTETSRKFQINNSTTFRQIQAYLGKWEGKANARS
jgi:hypothetical protein